MAPPDIADGAGGAGHLTALPGGDSGAGDRSGGGVGGRDGDAHAVAPKIAVTAPMLAANPELAPTFVIRRTSRWS